MRRNDIGFDRLRSKMETIFIEGQAEFDMQCKHHNKLCELYPNKTRDMARQKSSGRKLEP